MKCPVCVCVWGVGVIVEFQLLPREHDNPLTQVVTNTHILFSPRGVKSFNGEAIYL